MRVVLFEAPFTGTVWAPSDTCEALNLTLAPKHQPTWLRPLDEACKRYLKNAKQHGNQLANTVTTHYSTIQPIILPVDDTDDTSPFDLDAIYEQAKVSNRIPDLFDRMIQLLRNIIDSKAIDSVTVLQSLNDMLTMLQQNRDASHASMFHSFDFAKLWFRKFVVKLVKRAPVVAEAVESLEEAIEETDQAFTTAQSDVRQLMVWNGASLTDSSDSYLDDKLIEKEFSFDEQEKSQAQAIQRGV